MDPRQENSGMTVFFDLSFLRAFGGNPRLRRAGILWIPDRSIRG
jgi:hypothetical protein